MRDTDNVDLSKERYRLKRDIKKDKDKVLELSKTLKKSKDVPVGVALELEFTARNLLSLQAELNALEPEADSERIYRSAVKRSSKKKRQQSTNRG